VTELEERVDEQRRVRKQIHITIKKLLKAGFAWSPGLKKDCVNYMQGKGWDLRECVTEADVAIAKDCAADDIVITSDSDFVIYGYSRGQQMP